MAAERLSTVALVVLGSMAGAETTGVAVQSILTVGGIGGERPTVRLDRCCQRSDCQEVASPNWTALVARCAKMPRFCFHVRTSRSQSVWSEYVRPTKTISNAFDSAFAHV